MHNRHYLFVKKTYFILFSRHLEEVASLWLNILHDQCKLLCPGVIVSLFHKMDHANCLISVIQDDICEICNFLKNQELGILDIYY